MCFKFILNINIIFFLFTFSFVPDTFKPKIPVSRNYWFIQEALSIKYKEFIRFLVALECMPFPGPPVLKELD
jgi:hypothetical protein